MQWYNVQYNYGQANICAFVCLFLQMMLQGSSCLCQIQKEVTTSMPHLLMYVRRYAINFQTYLSVGLRVQEYGTLKCPWIVILYASLTNTVLIKLLARHKLFSICCNMPLFTCRATIRYLPTLLHKVNMLSNIPQLSDIAIYCCGLCILLQWFRS